MRLYSNKESSSQTKNLTSPRLLKGFHDLLPEVEEPRKRYLSRIENISRCFGFMPIETPILEYSDILLAKAGGESSSQIYRFKDHGNRDVSMRFDLTVPFARFMALNSHKVHTPFKRFQFGKVWRGENTQKGRYREFGQFDADIVGADSLIADFEILQLASESIKSLNLGKFTIYVSHRSTINRLLNNLNITSQSTSVLRIIDKIDSIGREEVTEKLRNIISESACKILLKYLTIGESNEETIKNMQSIAGKGPEIESLKLLCTWCNENNLLKSSIIINPAIIRGLDYYTGIVFETSLQDIPNLGSICSGGRYDNLVSLYSGKHLPGVGLSIGIDRIVLSLHAENKLIAADQSADTMIFFLDSQLVPAYFQTAKKLRELGVKVDLFPIKRKLKAQFSYAEQKNIPTGIFVEDNQLSKYRVRSLIDRKEWINLSLETTHRLIAKLSSQ